MARYFINNKAQANGDHEVHKQGCTFMPADKTELGEHSNCYSAIIIAKDSYSRVNGCYFCSKECHSS
ncbi:MAG TPA: hypothetical protein DIW47_11945 [Bacteroidetes bacterium]|nr:hypothetical protein [Bacteroidota bacterium]